MANALIDATMIVHLLAKAFGNLVHNCGEAYYEPSFGAAGAKIGSVVNLRLAALSPDLLGGNYATYAPVVLDRRLRVEAQIPTQDLKMSIEEFGRRHTKIAYGLARTLLRDWPLGAHMATADMPVPAGIDMAARASDPSCNVALRFTRFYDATRDELVSLIDILVGYLQAAPQEGLPQCHRLTALQKHRLDLDGQIRLLRDRAQKRRDWTP